MADTAKGLADEASSRDPDVGLQAVAALRKLLDQLEALQVQNARDHGWTWQEIADRLGVSRQAVHKKYGGHGLSDHLERLTDALREQLGSLDRE